MKYALVVGVLALLVFGALAWFYFDFHNPANAYPVQQKTKEVKFKVIDEGALAPSEPSRKNYAIYDQSTFSDFWKETHGGTEKGMPIIDFTKNYIIGVFAGTVASGGYSIAVTGITDNGTMENVAVVINQPGDTCNVVEEQTSPYQFVSVPVTQTQAFTHADARNQTDCR